MIQSTERGSLITRFWYTTPADPMRAIISAMPRDGAFLIERGRITQGVKNLRFSQDMLQALSRATMISEKTHLYLREDYGYLRWGVVAPTMKIERFEFTNKTLF